MPRPMYAKSGGKWWQVYPTPPAVVAPVLTATGGDTQVVLTWTAATGATVLSYEVEKNGVVENVGSVLTKTYTGLTNGQAYSFRVRAVVNYVQSPWSNTASATPVVPWNAATGGTVAPVDVPNYNGTGQTWRVHRFTAGGDFTVTAAPRQFNVLLVGGGGGGAGCTDTMGGGGGAGGMFDGLLTIPAGTHAVTVGNGGTGTGASTHANGTNGGDTGIHLIKAVSGGGGGADYPSTGNNGGSGGGGSSWNVTNGGAATVAGEGNAGGNGTSGQWQSGGGGGAGGAGTGNAGGADNGGAGKASTITGASVVYAKGGRGGSYGTGGDIIADGAANTGNGGSGGGKVNGPDPRRGGNGGSGIVIIAYRIA